MDAVNYTTEAQYSVVNQSLNYEDCAIFEQYGNCSSAFGHLLNQTRAPTMSSTRQLIGWLYLCLTPIIIIVGLCGNTLSFCVFVFTPLKSLSSSVYLAALAVADTGFLLTLTLTWLDLIKLGLFHTQGICQVAVYLTYVFSFLSVWYVVSFTVERFLAVGYPLHKHKLCTPRRAKLVVTALAGFAIVAYSFALWTSEVLTDHRGRKNCVPVKRHFSVVTVAGNVDTVVTLIIPFIIIVALNIRIVWYVMFREDAPRQVQTPSVIDTTGLLTTTTTSTSTATASQAKPKRRRDHVRGQTQAHITRMLVVVSTVFLLLNLPSHAMRLYFVVMSVLDRQDQITQEQVLMQQIFQFLYYTNFSVNFFLYSLCGRNFRRSLWRLLQACVRCKGEPLKRQGISFRWTGNNRTSEHSSDISMKTVTVQLSNTISCGSERVSL